MATPPAGARTKRTSIRPRRSRRGYHLRSRRPAGPTPSSSRLHWQDHGRKPSRARTATTTKRVPPRHRRGPTPQPPRQSRERRLARRIPSTWQRRSSVRRERPDPPAFHLEWAQWGAQHHLSRDKKAGRSNPSGDRLLHMRAREDRACTCVAVRLPCCSHTPHRLGPSSRTRFQPCATCCKCVSRVGPLAACSALTTIAARAATAALGERVLGAGRGAIRPANIRPANCSAAHPSLFAAALGISIRLGPVPPFAPLPQARSCHRPLRH